MSFCWLSRSATAMPRAGSFAPLSLMVRASSSSALATSAWAFCLSSRVWKILLACSPWYHQTLLVCLASSL